MHIYHILGGRAWTSLPGGHKPVDSTEGLTQGASWPSLTLPFLPSWRRPASSPAGLRRTPFLNWALACTGSSPGWRWLQRAMPPTLHSTGSVFRGADTDPTLTRHQHLLVPVTRVPGWVSSFDAVSLTGRCPAISGDDMLTLAGSSLGEGYPGACVS